jgi:hypothetical protein
MYSQLKSIIFIAIVSLAVTSCNRKEIIASTTPSEGMPGEVLVVSEDVSELKDQFEQFFTEVDSNLIVAEQADLMQYEKAISFWFAPAKSIEGSEKLAPVILVLNDAQKYSSTLEGLKASQEATVAGTSVSIFKNVWANPQTAVYIDASAKEFAELLKKGGFTKALNALLQEQIIGQGLPGSLSSNTYTDSISKIIASNYGFTFDFPAQFRLEYTNPEIVWLRQESNKFYRHIFINIFRDSALIATKEAAIQNRDVFTYKYLSNSEGTKVAVSKSNLFKTQFTREKIKGTDVFVLRGWYQEELTFRRGPFIRYFFHDTKNHRYIAFDCFLYAPEQNRLPFYRLFEIMAQGFKISE